MSEDQPRFEYRRDDAHRRLRVIAYRPLRPEDFVSVVGRQLAEGTWTYGVVYDMRGVGDIAASPVETRRIAEEVREQIAGHGERGPVAVVTPRANVIAVAQGYAHFARQQGFVVEVFWDVSEAEKWLDTQLGKDNREHATSDNQKSGS